MARRGSTWRIIHEYAAQPDLARCAQALVRILLWEPPPAPAGAAEAPVSMAPGAGECPADADRASTPGPPVRGIFKPQ
jgi:hypothetical protein